MSTEELLLVDGHEYQSDYSISSRESLQSNVQIQDAGAEPSERSLSRFGWKRTATDFVFGAGQEWFDQEDDRNRQRYFEAVGTSFSDRGMLRSIDKATRTTTSTTSVGTQILEEGSSGIGWWVNGTQISKLTNDGATQTVGAFLPGGNITGLVVQNGKVLIADGSGLYTSTEAGNSFATQLGSLTPDRLLLSSSRLIGMENNLIYEIAADGTKLGGEPTTGNIFDHPSSSFVWKGGIVAPNGIYVYGDDGRNVDVFLIVPTDATGDFAPPFPATPWPVGEIINGMEFFGGVVVFATNRGLRIATIGGSGFLTYGPVLDDVGAITCLANDGQYLYGGASFDAFKDSDYANGTEYTGLIRFKLAKFTDTLVPSWEMALVSSLGSGSTVTDCAVLWSQAVNTRAGTPIFAAEGATSTDRELWISDSAGLESPIIFRPGRITYGTPEPKSFLSFEIVIEGLASNDTVACTITSRGSVESLNVVQDEEVFRFTSNRSLKSWEFDPKVTITLGTPTAHADVRVERWTLRCLVLPEEVEVIEVGIIIDPETTGGRSRRLRDAYKEWGQLDLLSKTKEMVKLQIGSKIDIGYVDSFSLPRGASKDIPARSESGSFLQGTWVLRFITADDATI